MGIRIERRCLIGKLIFAAVILSFLLLVSIGVLAMIGHYRLEFDGIETTWLDDRSWSYGLGAVVVEDDGTVNGTQLSPGKGLNPTYMSLRVRGEDGQVKELSTSENGSNGTFII